MSMMDKVVWVTTKEAYPFILFCSSLTPQVTVHLRQIESETSKLASSVQTIAQKSSVVEIACSLHAFGQHSPLAWNISGVLF